MHDREDGRAFLRAAAEAGRPSLLDLSPEAGRSMTEAAKKLAEMPARDLVTKDLAIPMHDGTPIRARLYVPDARSEGPVIVYFHGGGWIVGSIDTHHALCAEICFASGLRVISVDYRLAPEFPFPTPLEDALDSVRWIADQSTFAGAPLRQIVLAGDSAGGGLAAVAARELRNALPVEIVAQWLIYPALDLSTSYASKTELNGLYRWTDEALERYYGYYLGAGDIDALKRDPRVSPVLATDWEGLAPSLIFTGSLDPLRDEGRAYAMRLVEHGVTTILFEAKGQIHGALALRKAVPSAQEDLLKSIGALRQLLAISR